MASEPMTPDELWAKSHVYSSKGLRVLLCPSGSLAVFDHRGGWIGLFERAEELLPLLVRVRDREEGPSAAPPLASATAASVEELGF